MDEDERKGRRRIDWLWVLLLGAPIVAAILFGGFVALVW